MNELNQTNITDIVMRIEKKVTALKNFYIAKEKFKDAAALMAVIINF